MPGLGRTAHEVRRDAVSLPCNARSFVDSMRSTNPDGTARAPARPADKDINDSCKGGSIEPGVLDGLYLLRHGESTCNEMHRFAGSADAPLTRLGRAQARTARSSDDARVDIVFTSPLSRARETADIFLPPHDGGTERRVDARLRERDFGEFTLKSKAELQRRLGIRGYDEALYGPNPAIDGAESFVEFHARVADFLHQTVKPLLESGKRVLVVSHKYVIELIARILLDRPTQDRFDLRIPNSRILRGSDLARYCKRESRALNRLRDWTLLYHERLISASALAGLLTSWSGAAIAPSPGFSAFLLALAAFVCLVRVDLHSSRCDAPAWRWILLRFAALPILIALLAWRPGSTSPATGIAWILAAPTATTSIVLSRHAGGAIRPTVGAIVRSGLVGSLITAALALTLPGASAATAGVACLGVATATLLIPLAGAAALRRLAPIAATTWAERQAVLAPLCICALAFLACAGLTPGSFLPYGALALATSIALRIASFLLARRGSRHRIDVFLSMAHPNLLAVILIGQASGLSELTRIASWCLLPMFLLAPLDLRICRALDRQQPVDCLDSAIPPETRGRR